MCHYVGAKWLFVGGVRLCVCRMGSAGCSSGSVWVVRCVDLETQKEGKKSTPKGREAKVTFTVQKRSHANNARVLCLECQLKTS